MTTGQTRDLAILKDSVLGSVVVHSSLGDCTDLRATTLFLSHIAARNRRTASEYAREVGRLLMWMAVRGRTLNELTYVELSDYLRVLDQPEMLRAIAAGLPHQGLANEFEKAFAIGSHPPRNGAKPAPGRRARNARPVLVSYLAWLAESGHRPPIAVPRVANSATASQRVAEARESIESRKLPQHLWKLIDDEIDSLDWTAPGTCVQKTILVWLRWSGVRRAAFTGALRRDISEPVARRPGSRTFRFWTVRGKGGTVRRVPLNDSMLLAYRQYTNTMGLGFAQNAVDEETAAALFAIPLREGKALRPVNGRDVYVMVVDLAQRAAARTFAAEDREKILQLRPHWFRHRRAFELEQTASLTAAAAFLGHASVTTTQIYSAAEELDLAELIY